MKNGRSDGVINLNMSGEMESTIYHNIYLMLIKTFHSLLDLLYIYQAELFAKFRLGQQPSSCFEDKRHVSNSQLIIYAEFYS